MRGGTSRGAFFLANDLPGDESIRNRVLSAAMGGPDALQIDGMGGGHPLTNKIAIISPSDLDNVDVDYLFLQLNPQTGGIDSTQNCGNMLAAVGPFAIEHGIVPAENKTTRVKVNMLNSGNLCELTVQTPAGQIEYEGNASIDGVPGTGAAIICDYLDVEGSATGALLPTGNALDVIDGVEVTLIDNGMPVVVVRARDLGAKGNETPTELELNKTLVAAKESMRLQAGQMMGLGDVSAKTVPKISLVSEPQSGGAISTRTFIPHACHKAIGVLGAASVATACLLPGTVTEGMAKVPEAESDGAIIFYVEHPSGSFQLRIRAHREQAGLAVESVGVVRTARELFRGEILIPRSTWQRRSSGISSYA